MSGPDGQRLGRTREPVRVLGAELPLCTDCDRSVRLDVPKCAAVAENRRQVRRSGACGSVCVSSILLLNCFSNCADNAPALTCHLPPDPALLPRIRVLPLISALSCAACISRVACGSVPHIKIFLQFGSTFRYNGGYAGQRGAFAHPERAHTYTKEKPEMQIVALTVLNVLFAPALDISDSRSVPANARIVNQ